MNNLANIIQPWADGRVSLSEALLSAVVMTLLASFVYRVAETQGWGELASPISGLVSCFYWLFPAAHLLTWITHKVGA